MKVHREEKNKIMKERIVKFNQPVTNQTQVTFNSQHGDYIPTMMNHFHMGELGRSISQPQQVTSNASQGSEEIDLELRLGPSKGPSKANELDLELKL
jgi:hypothetical protein